MSSARRAVCQLALPLAALMLAACADSGTAAPRQTVDDAAANDQGDADADDSGGTPDQEVPDTPPEDIETPDTGPDVVDSSGGEDPDTGTPDTSPDPVIDVPAEDVVTHECPFAPADATFPSTYLTDDAEPRQVLLIIESLDFVHDIVVIRNVSDQTGTGVTIDFDADWHVFENGASNFHLGAAFNLAPGNRLRIHTKDSGVADADDVYLGTNSLRLDACGGEIAIVHGTGDLINHPSYIEAYVAWGNRTPPSGTATFDDEAVNAGAWDVNYSEGNYATPTCWVTGETWCATGGASGPCDTTDLGLVANGDVTDPMGWARVETTDDATACFY